MIPLHDSQRCRTAPYVNHVLMAACVLVFLYEQTLPPEALAHLFRHWGTVPQTMLASIHEARWLDVALPSVTSQFLHAGWLHLGLNLLFLHIFGDNVEDRMGHWRYLLFFALCGFAGDAAHIASTPSSSLPAVGASGAISGILAAYLTMFPDARVTTLIALPFWVGLIEISAYWYVTAWLLLQIMDGLGTVALGLDGGVAHWAHAGGFFGGLLLVWLFDQGERWRGRHRRTSPSLARRDTGTSDWMR